MCPCKCHNPPEAYSKKECNVTCCPAERFESLRDKFAYAALTGMLANSERTGDPFNFSEAAYIYADAMMQARDKKN